MKRLRRQYRLLKVRLRSLGFRSRVVAASLAAATVGGALWLACTWRGSDMTPVTAGAMDRDDLASARSVLADRQIPNEVEDDKLLVPSSKLAAAREALARTKSLPAARPAAAADLADVGELWLTGDEKAHRWLEVKMATLGQLIGQFPQVRRATVLLDAGSPRRLGSQGSRPTAAVNVTLAEGAVMNTELVIAIADQVAASIAGMRRSDVRIVDSAGRSYAAVDAGDDTLARARAAESYFREKLRAALPYLPVASIVVEAGWEGQTPKCISAGILIPRSYFVAIYRGEHPSAGEPSDAELMATITAHLPLVEQSALQVLGASAPPKLDVGWYHDVAGSAAVGKAAVAAKDVADGDSAGSAKYLLAAAAPALSVIPIMSLVLLRRRRRRRAAVLAAAGGGEDEGLAEEFAQAQRSSRLALDAEALKEEPFAFLHDVHRENVVSLIEDEHPQTAALVLAHFSPARAAGILAALPPSRQVDVVRRVAELGPVDAEVVREVREHLQQRLAEAPPRGELKIGGVGKIAEILHHAGYATEQKVLDGLAGHEPELADSIRNRMFVFEDIAGLPAHRLRPALEPLEAEELAIALRTAGDALKKKVFSSLPSRTAREVRDEMERIGPVRLSDVEAAQNRVMDAIRRSERGEYVTSQGANEIVA